ncbi:MAG: DUF6057 family protein [Planctomycetia bacterium]|nr:DUF6057 family protein [Planctomycetia bacterium]
MLETTSLALPRSRVNASLSVYAWTSLAFFFVLCYFWGVRYGDYLYALQENSVFLYTREYLARWLQTPDGALSYATSFLLQFAYYPLLGGVILAALGVTVQLILARLLPMRGVKYLLTFLPSCFYPVSTTWPSYYVFLPYNLPVTFGGQLALLICLLLFMPWRRVNKARVRMPLALLAIAALYPLAGFWSVFFGVLCALEELTRSQDVTTSAKRNARVVRAATLLIAAFVLPYLYFYAVYFQRMLVRNVLLQGLIEDVRYDKDVTTSFFTYGFAALSPLFVWLGYLACRVRALRVPSDDAKSLTRAQRKRLKALEEKTLRVEKRARSSKRKSDKNERAKDQTPAVEPTDNPEALATQQSRVQARLLWELWVVLMACMFLLAYHSRTFFDVFKSARALIRADWQTIIEVDQKNPFPHEALVGLRNLALYETGELSQRAFERPIGGLSAVAVTQRDNERARQGNGYYKLKMALHRMRRTAELNANFALVELQYCYWGQTNIGARVAMNNLIGVDDRAVSFFKTLAFAAMINGEERLARRYLYTLEQTLFHRHWARVALAYLDSPGFYDDVRDWRSDAQYQAIVDAQRARAQFASSLAEAAQRYRVCPEEVERLKSLIDNARLLRPPVDRALTPAIPTLAYITGLFNFEEYDQANEQRQELILLSALFQKKGEDFMAHADDYFARFKPGEAPKALEQGYATLRYIADKKTWDKGSYQFSDATRQGMADFIEFADYVGTHASAPEAQAYVRENFSGQYWGYLCDDSVFDYY